MMHRYTALMLLFPPLGKATITDMKAGPNPANGSTLG